MELHTRVELIDTLIEEADQKMQALHHALAAQERAKEERRFCRKVAFSRVWQSVSR
jgi:hypothetical protein